MIFVGQKKIETNFFEYYSVIKMTNKKVVVATMPVVEMYFKVPDGIDLEDKNVVEDYWYKYGSLHIKYVDKDDIETIEAYYEDDVEMASFGVFKYADNLEIKDNDECDVPYESDEED